MPRKARKRSQTSLYHIMMRGNNKHWIFAKDDYKKLYLKRFFKKLKESDVECYAWCMMDNHGHFVLAGDIKDISELVKSVGTYFAGKFNYFESRSGHVFQDRYKSEIIDDEDYLVRVIRYVHRNPVQAKLVNNCCDYNWSSYNQYFKNADIYEKRTINVVKVFFHNNLQYFENYHTEESEEEHLDLKEVVHQGRVRRAKKIINKYRYQLDNCTNFFGNETLRDELINILKVECHLTYNQIAQLTGISYNCVQKIAKSK